MPGLLAAAFAAAWAASAAPAAAADRWEEAGSGSVAILPVPAAATGITGGSLGCEEQRWSFRLRTDPAVAFQPSSSATIQIDKARLSAKAAFSGGTLTIPFAYEDLDALKRAVRLVFSIGEGKGGPAASFSLRNSKAVIEAVAPRCSQIDMAGYDKVVLADSGAAPDEARPLLEAEAGLFREATKKEPVLAAARVEASDGKALLFASLCGSTWYYGRSGCTLYGFGRTDAAGGWQEVYNSEGVVLYVDPKGGHDGWPNLVTLPVVGGTEATHWSWTGSAYALADRVAADETGSAAQ